MRSILLTCFVAGLTSHSALVSRGAENVLDMIPRGACGAVVFNRMAETDTKIRTFAREWGYDDLRYWGNPWFT